MFQGVKGKGNASCTWTHLDAPLTAQAHNEAELRLLLRRLFRLAAAGRPSVYQPLTIHAVGNAGTLASGDG
jgi:hypothetical protein